MAAPNPERELARLDRLLEGLPQGTPPRCVTITGVSSFFRNEAVRKVLAKVPPEHDRRTIDGEGDRETDGRELMDLRGTNLFGAGSFLAVRRGDSWLKRHGPLVPDALSAMGRTSGFLLEVQKLDKRTRVAKRLRELGQLFEFRDLYTEPYDRSRSPLTAEMVEWLVHRSQRCDCPLTPESGLLLMGTVGTRPAELLQELSRLATEVGKQVGKAGPALQPLSPADLSGHLTCSFESTPFEFAEAVLAHDRRRALRSLVAMYRRGTRSRDGGAVDAAGLFPFITSWLYQALNQVREGRALFDAGVSLREIPGRAGVRVFVDRYLQQVQGNEAPQLDRGLRLLLDCQRELRTTGEDAQLLLERFLARHLAPPETISSGAGASFGAGRGPA